ncbi:hypothetical protein ACFLQ0_00335 [Nitrospinota bacterium]
MANQRPMKDRGSLPPEEEESLIQIVRNFQDFLKERKARAGNSRTTKARVISLTAQDTSGNDLDEEIRTLLQVEKKRSVRALQELAKSGPPKVRERAKRRLKNIARDQNFS